jgi:hypothetical protein
MSVISATIAFVKAQSNLFSAGGELTLTRNRQYDDFDLIFQWSGALYSAQLVKSPVGEGGANLPRRSRSAKLITFLTE